MSRPVHATASDVAARDGDVHIDGPEGVAYSLTPDAAAETSDRLLHGAAMAKGQRAERKRRADERFLRR